MRCATSQADVVTLLLNRCHARLSSQHFDAAVADAKAVLEISPGNQKALFRAARASHGLRQFHEGLDFLKELVVLHPENSAAPNEIKRCQSRLREEAGEYDFAAMLDEATEKLPSPDMDRGTYIGPIEVRKCSVESHGRGLFTTKDVKAGDLLLCEKSFSIAFAKDDDEPEPEPEQTDTSDDDSKLTKFSLKLRAELATKTFVKLHRNPSLIPAFADLYPGPDADEDIDVKTGVPFADE